MTQRFDELYIKRGEHQEIVTYYKKLVVHLYSKIRAMRAESAEKAPVVTAPVEEPKVVPQPLAASVPPPQRCNVVNVDFRNRCRFQ